MARDLKQVILNLPGFEDKQTFTTKSAGTLWVDRKRIGSVVVVDEFLAKFIAFDTTLIKYKIDKAHLMEQFNVLAGQSGP